MSCLQKVRTRSSQLLVQGFDLHYGSRWLKYYWSNTTLQHGPLLHREQPPRALHLTSLLQDLYYMTSVLFRVSSHRSPSSATM